LGAVPAADKQVADSQGGGRVGGELVAVVHAAGEGGLDMADDFALESVLVLEPFDLVFAPCGPLRLGDRGYLDAVLSALLLRDPLPLMVIFPLSW
jgi:hypothetical protein